MAAMALGGQGGGDKMGWSAEYIVHPLETGPKYTGTLSTPLLSVCLPVPSHIMASLLPKEVYLARKESLLMLALKIPESERRGEPHSS